MIFRIVDQPGPTRSYHLLQTKRTSMAVLSRQKSARISGPLSAVCEICT